VDCKEPNASVALFFFIFSVSVFISPCLNAQEETYTDLPFWRQALGGAIIAPPVSQVESVLVVTDGGNLKSFSWQGTPLWDFYARGRLTPHVSRSREGTSYVCRTNGVLIAVNRSGRELWALSLKSPLVSPVLTGWDGRLFVFTAGEITCLTASGYTLWSKVLEKKIIHTPINDALGGFIILLEDGEVRRYSQYGNVFSYKSTRGVPNALASLEIDDSQLTILLLHENNLELVSVSENSFLQGTHISLRGILDLPSPPVSAIGRKGEAAVLLNDGRVALISLKKLDIIWVAVSHASAGELRDSITRNGTTGSTEPSAELLFDERGIFLVTKSGATGFTSDGRRLWTIRLRGTSSLPSFGDDGILYSGGTDWVLYAYRLEDRVRAKKRLLYGEAQEGSYGLGNPGPSSMAGYYFRFSETEMNARLNEIRNAIKEGNVGANEREYAAWLMETSGSLIANLRAEKPLPVQAFYRVEAARLLGYIGSRETVPFLADLFRRDPELAVKAAAAEAIGRIGVDPDGTALWAFQREIYSIPKNADDALLTAIASATGALCRFSGPPLSEAGVRILTALSSGSLPGTARRQAQREIRSLTN